jgi:hypothetical protein
VQQQQLLSLLPLQSPIEHQPQLLDQQVAHFFLLVLFLPATGCFQSMPKSFGFQNVVIVLAVRDSNMDAIVALEV